MKYALLIYSPPGTHEALPERELEAAYAEYNAISDDARCVGEARLQPVENATTVRIRDGETLMTDGPFADTKEIFGGFYLIDADSVDEAVNQLARQ